MRRATSIIQSLQSRSEYSERLDTILQHYQDPAFLGYNSYEDYVVRGPENPNLSESRFNGFVRLISQLLSHVFQEFRQDSIFLAPEIVYELAYELIRRTPNTFTDQLVRTLRSAAPSAKAAIAFPLYNFGFQDAGAKLFFTRTTQWQFSTSKASFYPQTNSLSAARSIVCQFLQSNFGRRSKLDLASWNHTLRSRPVQWIHKNPFAMLSFPGFFSGPRSLQAFILQNIEKEMNKLIVYSIIKRDSTVQTSGSVYDLATRGVNFFATRDVKHYLLMVPKNQRNEFAMSAVPLHRLQGAFFDLLDNDLLIDISRPTIAAKRRIQQVWSYIDHCFHQVNTLRAGDNAHAFYKRTLLSFEFFRRALSNYSSVDKWIFFGSAVEILLSEGVNGSLTTTIARNAAFLAEKRKVHIKKAVQDLYDIRSQAIHLRAPPSSPIQDYFRVYIAILEGIQKALKSRLFDANQSRPIHEYIRARIRKGQINSEERALLANQSN